MNTEQEIIKKQEYIIKVLENRIIQATDTINNQNATISSFSTAYTVAGWLLGILAFISTFAIYLFGIKPSEEAIDNLENTMDGKIIEYFNDKHTEDMKYAINNLESDNVQNQNKGLYYLQLNLYDSIPEDKLYRIVNIAKSNKLNEQQFYALTQYLYYSDSKIVKEYFEYILTSNSYNVSVKNISSNYFTKPSQILEGLETIKNYVINSKDASNDFSDLVRNFIETNNKEAVTFLINDIAIVKAVKEHGESLGMTYDEFRYYLYINHLGGIFEMNELKKTYMYKNFNDKLLENITGTDD
ncbi:hypothetical protein KJK34_07830 [Flavobacterium sp. D11R37]|uniref:hypothetical protein n=1 Tax=Flavobacterium coralii TaxID=2838017 RepID=UPI001CA78E86|nr:hypothetical protein [Flavobacterium coralii]MBY8962659.1 hypothetical protein [Flavobacterium coralii]